MSKVFTEDDVAKHNTESDCWLIIGEPGKKKVYDVTPFLEDHPGGPEIMTDNAGEPDVQI
jgi:cytochrome b involved in lipid metabolism